MPTVVKTELENDNSRMLQYSTCNNGEINQTKSQQRNSGLKEQHGPNGPERNMQIFQPNHNRIYILYKHTWNTFQRRSHVRSQNKS